MASPVVIVGAGVSGLTCGVRLIDAGRRVRIIAREHPALTTSATAGAIWFPARKRTDSRIDKWEQVSFEVFCHLAQTDCVPVQLLELLWLSDGVMDLDPDWLQSAPYLRARIAREEELPTGYRGGRVVCVPCIQAPAYLHWLLNRFCARGGEVEFGREVETLQELDTEVVVNCTGLGAVRLADDTTVRGVRGQVAYVKSDKLLRGVFSETEVDGLLYVFPRSDVVVVGGTSEPDDSDARVRPSTTELLLKRAQILQPDISDAVYVGASVGFRPSRPTVRLATEQLDRSICIHNYGHGGHGFTLSWGCAAEVAALVETALG